MFLFDLSLKFLTFSHLSCSFVSSDFCSAYTLFYICKIMLLVTIPKYDFFQSFSLLLGEYILSSPSSM